MRLLPAICSGVLCFNVWAQEADPPEDPRVTALEREVKLLEAKATIAAKKAELAAARYGSAPTAPTGAIENPNAIASFGQRALVSAYDAIGTQAQAILEKKAGQSQCEKFVVTSDDERRGKQLAAQMIFDTLMDFTAALEKVANTKKPAALAPSLNAIAGVAGSFESIMGMFRSDYSAEKIELSPDNLALRVVVAEKLREKSTEVAVDGMDFRSDGGEIYAAYRSFNEARRSAEARLAALKTLTPENDQPKLMRDATVLEAAVAFDSALTTPTEGIVPLTEAATSRLDKGSCVVYVAVSGFSASTITRKRLWSTNAFVAVDWAGSAIISLSDSAGRLVAADLFGFSKRRGARLSEMMRALEALDPSSPNP